jgi:hypothetical protein
MIFVRVFSTKCFHTILAPRARGHVATITMLSELGCSWRLRRRDLDLGLYFDLLRFNKIISPIDMRSDISNRVLGHIPFFVDRYREKWAYSSIQRVSVHHGACRPKSSGLLSFKRAT